jgi:hypothetical protein
MSAVLSWILAHREVVIGACIALAARIALAFPRAEAWFRETSAGRVLVFVLLAVCDVFPDVGRLVQRFRAATSRRDNSAGG